ncbi:rhomboid family intramembrane serine protease [Pigmentibacter sp. JX0631]|uniref:rhomboid family intramembrane serine protease n=1 Tax=Pigmentibacter sp. JX0631 TaxID=2976982 RepID=UPI002468ADA4|nr:rhomboid family intramembrane serine protease [Pigmentibacter sp. JX0631]WGL60891.1 rhomboid family intramembrane serine protease [Pigmentibacter sp. JX0631]
MFGFWSVGRIFEYIAGSKNLIILYFIAGITGNICSFAFIPSTSVGASSSLFGILFCLYVIQKYEEKISAQLKHQRTGMQLGNIILINIILNIGFGIFSTIFDWAAHLGGSIAGILFGFALTTKHNWNLKIILSEKNNSIVKKKFFDNYYIYFIAIFVVDILFLLSFFNIKNYQIVYGEALKKAAKNNTTYLRYSDLSQYEFILAIQNKETNPQNILQDALFLHDKNIFFSAIKIYEVLLLMIENNFYSPKFSNPENKRLITESLNLAKSKKPLPKELVEKISNISKITSDICSKPAALFMTLGYFDISGSLYECALGLDLSENTFAVKSVESFYLANDKNKINEILSLVVHIEDEAKKQK